MKGGRHRTRIARREDTIWAVVREAVFVILRRVGMTIDGFCRVRLIDRVSTKQRARTQQTDPLRNHGS